MIVNYKSIFKEDLSSETEHVKILMTRKESYRMISMKIHWKRNRFRN